ncbi:MAG: choice-of-anchor L domain-containing protein [Bacteroidales bacterium]|nr:choice-of-anchor L domain-containing protein [Bacteroidales bacterium]
MKKISLILSLLMGVVLIHAQNLTTTSLSGQSPNTIVQAHLAGEGVLLSGGNIHMNGGGVMQLNPAKFNNSTGNVATAQIGTFNSNGFNFPISTGLIMTTGNVSVANGPNSAGGSSQAVATNLIYHDPQLVNLASGSLGACSVLDFQFIAFADTFSFNYVFASDEYPEYVCSSYNDVFAFFLDGYDPVTFTPSHKNVAIIPGTILPVTINNLNGGYTSGSASGCQNGTYQAYYVANHTTGTPGVEFDGYTVKLAAQAVILACQTYDMHLSICNVGDNAFDSGVFLEEGSFYSPKIEVDAFAEGLIAQSPNDTLHSGDTLVQNCKSADIVFDLPRPNMTAYTLEFGFGGNASVGTDYFLTRIGSNGNPVNLDLNNSSFSFQDSLELHVNLTINPEATFTTPKTVELYIFTDYCQLYADDDQYDTLVFVLMPNPKVQLTDTTFKACHECTELTSVVQGGGPMPITFHWLEEGAVDDPNSMTTSCSITSDVTLHLTATDYWECMSDTANISVEITEQPVANPVVTPTFGCSPLPVVLTAQDLPDGCVVVWTLTNDTITIIDSTNNAHLTLPDFGYYDVNLWLSSAPGCNDSILLMHAIHVADFPHASFTFAPDEAQNGQPVTFFNLSEGDDITNYQWLFGDGGTSYESDPTHAYHVINSENMLVRLTVTNGDGCSDDTTMIVPVVDNFALWVPNAFTPNNDGNNEIFLPVVNEVAYYQLEIYNRTGELFFVTNSTLQGWDGTVNGKNVQTGVYVWRITYAKYADPTYYYVREGELMLIR